MSIVRGFFSAIFAFLLTINLVFLGIAIAVNSTALNPDFVVSEMDKLDVYYLATNQMKAQLPTAELPIEDAYLTQLIDKPPADLKP